MRFCSFLPYRERDFLRKSLDTTYKRKLKTPSASLCVLSFSFSTASGTWTRTAITGQRILSPSCLPIPPSRLKIECKGTTKIAYTQIQATFFWILLYKLQDCKLYVTPVGVWRTLLHLRCRKLYVTPVGFKPTTFRTGIWRSIQLSYGTIRTAKLVQTKRKCKYICYFLRCRLISGLQSRTKISK